MYLSIQRGSSTFPSLSLECIEREAERKGRRVWHRKTLYPFPYRLKTKDGRSLNCGQLESCLRKIGKNLSILRTKSLNLVASKIVYEYNYCSINTFQNSFLII